MLNIADDQKQEDFDDQRQPNRLSTILEIGANEGATAATCENETQQTLIENMAPVEHIQMCK